MIDADIRHTDIRTPEAPPPFHYLPPEINLYLLDWLDLKALAQLRGVCQFFCTTIDFNNLLIKAANNSFVSKVVLTNNSFKKIPDDNRIRSPIFFLEDLFSAHLRNSYPKRAISYELKSRVCFYDHDETLLNLMLNQAHLKNWQAGYSLLTSFHRPAYQILGYMVLVEQGKEAILDAYPQMIEEMFKLIETFDSKWHKAFVLLTLSISLAPFHFNFGLESFNKAKAILLNPEDRLLIPNERDQPDFFCCVEKLGVSSLFYNIDLFKDLSKELFETEACIPCGVNLASILCQSQWIIRRLMEKKETASATTPALIEACIDFSKAAPPKQQELIIKKVTSICTRWDVPLTEKIKKFLEETAQYGTQISILEAQRKQDPSTAIEQAIQEQLSNWLQDLRKFPWKRVPKQLSLQQKVEELISFIKKSQTCNFQEQEAFELLDQVKAALLKQTNIAVLSALVNIVRFEIDLIDPENVEKTAKEIHKRLVSKCTGITPKNIPFYELRIKLAYIKNKIDAIKDLNQLKKEALQFIKTTGKNQELGTKLIRSIANAEKAIEDPKLASRTLSSLQDTLKAKMENGTVRIIKKCGSSFKKIIKTQSEVEPSRAFKRLRELDQIIVNQIKTLKRKRESGSSKQPLKKSRLTPSQLVQLRPPIYQKFLYNTEKNEKQSAQVVSLVSQLIEDCQEAHMPYARSIDRWSLASHLLEYDPQATNVAWSAIALIENPCIRAQSMIKFKATLEKKKDGK